MAEGSGKSRKGSGRRGPMKATPEALERAARAHLERYAASAEHLRRLLLARVGRSARAHGTDPEAGAAAVEAIVGRYLEAGVLDDAAYAAGQVRRLHRAGASARAIRWRLAAKGVAPGLVTDALQELGADAADPELEAALNYARRRRLGPYRPATERTGRRDRDLAALDRRGFDLEVARRVIDAEDSAALEREVTADPHEKSPT